MSAESVGDGDKMPSKLDALQQLQRAREITGQMRSVVELHRTIKILEDVLRGNKADRTQTPPEGHVFLVSPLEKTRSWTYVKPNPSYDMGPNRTELPIEKPNLDYDITTPFTAHELVASYSGIYAVNLVKTTCILLEDILGEGVPVADIELTPIE